jgi:hypothetical protein
MTARRRLADDPLASLRMDPAQHAVCGERMLLVLAEFWLGQNLSPYELGREGREADPRAEGFSKRIVSWLRCPLCLPAPPRAKLNPVVALRRTTNAPRASC